MAKTHENEVTPTIARETEFWVVTKPTDDSMVCDICFETGLAGLQRQFAGGLEAKDIMGVWLDRLVAEKAATRLLELRDAGFR